MANSELAERREFAYASIQNGIDTLSQPGVLPELRPGYQDEILGYLGNLVVPVLTPIVRNGVAGLEVNPTDAYNENSFTVFAGKAGESFFLNPSLLKQTDE